MRGRHAASNLMAESPMHLLTIDEAFVSELSGFLQKQLEQTVL
jgi:hypothetical protein